MYSAPKITLNITICISLKYVRAFWNTPHLKTYLENVPAQSTPQTYRSRAGVRRQSSVGPMQDTSPLTGGGGGNGGAAVSTPAHSATLPVSSLSTNPSSYYTNASPSPPAASVPSHQHVSCDDILASPTPPAAARAPSCRSAPHSALNLHQTARAAALPFSNERTQTAAQVSEEQRVNDQKYARLPTVTRCDTYYRILSRLNIRTWGRQPAQPRWRRCWLD